MKKPNLGQTISTLANLGVIAGIVFLGFELQQNNELLQTQVRSNFQGARLQVNTSMAESPWLPEIFAKVQAGEVLSAAERIRLQAHHQVILTVIQWMYEDAADLEIEPPADRYRALFRGETLTPLIEETWETYKNTVSPEFAEWMEENVVNER